MPVEGGGGREGKSLKEEDGGGQGEGAEVGGWVKQQLCPQPQAGAGAQATATTAFLSSTPSYSILR